MKTTTQEIKNLIERQRHVWFAINKLRCRARYQSPNWQALLRSQHDAWNALKNMESAYAHMLKALCATPDS